MNEQTILTIQPLYFHLIRSGRHLCIKIDESFFRLLASTHNKDMFEFRQLGTFDAFQ
ncbi:hypothetical protein D3C74_478560 [compost metagenome]